MLVLPIPRRKPGIDQRRGRADVDDGSDGRQVHDDIVVTLPKLVDEIPKGQRRQYLVGMSRLLVERRRKPRRS